MMTMKRFRGGEVMREKMDDDGKIKSIIVYQQFDLGKKYKVYTKVDGTWRYADAFDSMLQAMNYMK